MDSSSGLNQPLSSPRYHLLLLATNVEVSLDYPVPQSMATASGLLPTPRQLPQGKVHLCRRVPGGPAMVGGLHCYVVCLTDGHQGGQLPSLRVDVEHIGVVNQPELHYPVTRHQGVGVVGRDVGHPHPGVHPVAVDARGEDRYCMQPMPGQQPVVAKEQRLVVVLVEHGDSDIDT
jgi:hypothetical protein